MARRVTTGIVFVLALFALQRVVPAQQPAPNAQGQGAQPGAPVQPGANAAGRGAQAPRESRVVRLDPAFDAIVPPGSNAEDVSVSAIAGPVLTRSNAPTARTAEAIRLRVGRPLPSLCHRCSGREKPIGAV